jgi:hypothetical protein
MIRRSLSVVVMAAAVTSGAAFGQTKAPPTVLGAVRLSQAVMANGQPLAAGTYQVRLTTDTPAAVIGESPNGERWVEFTKGGVAAGREVATVISAGDIGSVAKGPRPAAGAPRVELLKGGEYVRVWIVRGANNYLVNLRVPAK